MTVSIDIREGIAEIRLDDGKANAVSPALLEALHAALDTAEKQASAVVLAGREGRFSAGFDLKVVGAGGDASRNLVSGGAELCLRLLEFPKPLVAACTGHALAAGILVALSCDYRVGARGAFKIGLNEVTIGMALPHFAAEIARARLSKRHFARATIQAEIYAPDDAVDAGYLDEVVEADQVVDVALAHAKRMAQLNSRAFAATKRSLQGPFVGEIREHLKSDLARLLPG